MSRADFAHVIDFNNICEAAGVRIQDFDHGVREAVNDVAECKTLQAVVKKATAGRTAAVRREKFLTAFIYDTILKQAELYLENET